MHLCSLLVSFRALLAVQLDCLPFDIPVVLEFWTVHYDWCNPVEHLNILGWSYIKLEFPWFPDVHRINTSVALHISNFLGISLSVVWGAVILFPFQYYSLRRYITYGPISPMPWCRDDKLGSCQVKQSR